MYFAEDVKKDMKSFSLKVPLYKEPNSKSEILKYYGDLNQTFIFVERAKGSWIKVVDQDGDTGWVSSYLLRFGPQK